VGEAGQDSLLKFLRSRIFGEARQCITDEEFADIDALKVYLKSIYGPSKSVQQLLGELGNLYQYDHESVIAFANRVRELGIQIHEAYKSRDGQLTEANRTSTEVVMLDSFKRGLNPEIEQRLTGNANLRESIKSAIKIEKKLELQRQIRKMPHEAKPLPRKINFCETCKKDGHESKNCNTQKTCTYCKKTGHLVETCFKKENDQKSTCQLCGKPGHIAKNCFKFSDSTNPKICQICNKTGHEAKDCYLYINKAKIDARAQLNCQLCNTNGHTAATCRQNPNKTQNSENVCRYCKNPGHNIENCLKRAYNNSKNPGNGQGLPSTSAPAETAAIQQKRSNLVMSEDLFGIQSLN
jgi:hypothetical protein